MSPPGEPTACGKCGDALLAHMRATAGKLSPRLRVHERRVMDLLRLRWHMASLWIWDRPLAAEVKRAELQLLHEVLHELAVNGSPADASSPVLARVCVCVRGWALGDVPQADAVSPRLLEGLPQAPEDIRVVVGRGEVAGVDSQGVERIG